MKKLAKWLGAVALIALLALAVALVVAHEPRPEGRAGPEADALAARLEEAVDVEAWAKTGAVRWTFAGRNHHLWDRSRRLARVRSGDSEVLLRLDDRSGVASRGGRQVEGDEAAELLEEAYAAWVNDAFWLNPIAMFRGQGVSRSLVDLEEGERGLLIAYSSGGLTPGDAYLWIPGEGDLPRAWRMWVSIIPIGGVEASWERWRRLETGALVSTLHRLPLGLTLELTDVAGAETLEALVGRQDPFEQLSR